MLKKAGYAVTSVKDGAEALLKIQQISFDLAFLDIRMPKLTGLEVLARVRLGTAHPKMVIMTSDGTPESVLSAVREQAYEYLSKPFPPREAVEVAQRALQQNASPPIEVVSAKPHWVELLSPCTREAADRIESFLMKLDTDLPNEQRNTIGLAFRELLLNAVEWGGRLDPNRKVRIAYVRSSRILLYRIADPGAGFNFKELAHAAAGQPAEEPFAHVRSATSSAFAPEGLASRWSEPLRTSCCITRRRTKYSSSNTSTRFSWKRGRSAEEVPSHHHPELRRPQECLLRRPTHTGSPNGHDITCENH